MTAKEQVLKVYPDAFVKRTYGYPKSEKQYVYAVFMYKPGVISSKVSNWANSTEQAWQSALTKINEKWNRKQ